MVRIKQAGEKTDWGLPREWAQNRVRRARPHREGTGSGSNLCPGTTPWKSAFSLVCDLPGIKNRVLFYPPQGSYFIFLQVPGPQPQPGPCRCSFNVCDLGGRTVITWAEKQDPPVFALFLLPEAQGAWWSPQSVFQSV